MMPHENESETERLAALEGELARAELHVRLQDVQIGVLLRAVAALEERVAALRAEAAGLRDELRALQRRVGDLGQRPWRQEIGAAVAPERASVGWFAGLLVGILLGVLLAAAVWWALGAVPRPAPLIPV